MSTYIHLDSIFRDRERYPNPASYTVPDEDIKTWFIQPRTIKGVPQKSNIRGGDFAVGIKVINFIMPWMEVLQDVPALFLIFECQDFKDRHLISKIGGRFPRVRFFLEFDKVQNNSSGEPAWLHYKSNVDQVMRFNRRCPVNFEVQFLTGVTVVVPDSLPPAPPDPTEQIQAVFEITPYSRDEDFNHPLSEEFVV